MKHAPPAFIASRDDGGFPTDSIVNTATDSLPSDPPPWRAKYLDTLGLLEREQQRFAAVEAALKRIAGRLCTAALGQSPVLDVELRKLQNVLRKDCSSEALEQLTPALTEAIQSLDEIAPLPPAPMPVEPPVDDRQLRAHLTALIGELRESAQNERLDALTTQLGDSLPRERYADVIGQIAELVGDRIQKLEREKHEIEALLGQMVGKLDEINQFVAAQNRTQIASHESSETLEVQLQGEMRAMGESVEHADDLQQLREQVRSRLESIDTHVQQFREREAALANEMRERSEQMRSRIEQLEREAQHLHCQLKDEQRLAAIDALTGIANRLAYEKRIDEEIKRWERFAQPTCLAVWDVDHFKKINDSYGHRAGDRVLRTVAACLSSRIRSTDFIARYGGEEFVMLLSGTSLTDAQRLIEALRAAVAAIEFHFRGTPVDVTMSIGLTALAPNDTAESAFDRADKALYRAKQAGRDRCVSG